MTTNEQMVKEFHDKYHFVSRPCGQPAWERSLLNIRLITEELAELIEALELKDYPAVAKEIADLLYVTYGIAQTLGVPVNVIFAAVHTSNMTKELKLDGGGKLVKGNSYEPPDIAALLEVYMKADKEWRKQDGSS